MGRLKNPHHPYLGPPVKLATKFPKVTEAMKTRCRERNVHVWDLAVKKENGRCIACGISEEDAARKPAEWRVQHA